MSDKEPPENPLVSNFRNCLDAYMKVYVSDQSDPVQVACMSHAFFMGGGFIIKACQDMIREKATRLEIDKRLRWMAADIEGQITILAAKESRMQ